MSLYKANGSMVVTNSWFTRRQELASASGHGSWIGIYLQRGSCHFKAKEKVRMRRRLLLVLFLRSWSRFFRWEVQRSISAGHGLCSGRARGLLPFFLKQEVMDNPLYDAQGGQVTPIDELIKMDEAGYLEKGRRSFSWILHLLVTRLSGYGDRCVVWTGRNGLK